MGARPEMSSRQFTMHAKRRTSIERGGTGDRQCRIAGRP